MNENEYKNGESQRGLLVATSRKSWKISRRLTSAALATLRAFWDARKGPTEPFYFYDVWETDPQFSYDPTGIELVGRYVVRFDGTWNQSAGLRRTDVDISLIQIT